MRTIPCVDEVTIYIMDMIYVHIKFNFLSSVVFKPFLYKSKTVLNINQIIFVCVLIKLRKDSFLNKLNS